MNTFETVMASCTSQNFYSIHGLNFSFLFSLASSQWYRESEPVGARGSVELAHGDLYAMSHKVVNEELTFVS